MSNRGKNLTKEEKQFLINNYSYKGIDYCSKYLKFSKIKTKSRANYLGLKLQKYDYIKDFYPITPQSAYTLGFFTGDGWLCKEQASIEINIDDAIKLKDIFMFTPWKIYTRQRENWKETMKFCICNMNFTNWLKQHNFHNKNKTLPNIENLIPKQYLHLFLLGLFDADGCICSKLIKYGTLQIAAQYEYDWSDIINLFKNNIKVEVKKLKSITKKGYKSSTINVYEHNNLQKIYNYLYQTYDQDKIGLPRKYDKFKFVLEQFNN